MSFDCLKVKNKYQIKFHKLQDFECTKVNFFSTNHFMRNIIFPLLSTVPPIMYSATSPKSNPSGTTCNYKNSHLVNWCAKQSNSNKCWTLSDASFFFSDCIKTFFACCSIAWIKSIANYILVKRHNTEILATFAAFCFLFFSAGCFAWSSAGGWDFSSVADGSFSIFLREYVMTSSGQITFASLAGK